MNVYNSFEFKSRFVIKTTADRKMSTEKKRIIVGPFPEATTWGECRRGWQKKDSKKEIQIFESMIYHTIEWSFGERRNVCAWSFKIDKKTKQEHTSYIENYIQHLKYAGKTTRRVIAVEKGKCVWNLFFA